MYNVFGVSCLDQHVTHMFPPTTKDILTTIVVLLNDHHFLF